MFFLIDNGQIIGTTTDASSGAGFQVAIGPNLPIADLYWDGNSIQERPPRPPGSYWDPIASRWQGLPATMIPRAADWKGLENDFRGSPIYGRIYQAASVPNENTIEALIQTQRAATAHSLLLAALTSTHSEDDLAFAISELRAVMAQSPTGGLSSEDVAFINGRLEERGLNIRLE